MCMKNNTLFVFFFITDMVAMVTKLLNHRWLGCMLHCGWSSECCWCQPLQPKSPRPSLLMDFVPLMMCLDLRYETAFDNFFHDIQISCVMRDVGISFANERTFMAYSNRLPYVCDFVFRLAKKICRTFYIPFYDRYNSPLWVLLFFQV